MVAAKPNSMWNSSRYIVVMSLAAAIALVRGFFVAGILDLPSFGLYATVLAAGMFSSTLLSFGEIERTIKSFPRLWIVEHHRASMLEQVDKSLLIMVRRAGAVFVVLAAGTFSDAMQSSARSGILVVLIALGAALSSLYASAIRATGDIDLLARNSLLRAVIVIAFGLSGAYFFNWQGALLGEVMAAILGAAITRHSAVRKAQSFVGTRRTFADDATAPSFDGGRWLFAAGLLVSAPVYLDRAFVASAYGAAMVGTFGFLMLFVTGANTLTGIVAQKVGPQLVKMEYQAGSVEAQVKLASGWVGFICVICVAGMAALALAFNYWPAQYFYQKFNLHWEMIAAATLLCVLQVGVLLEFILISRNHERAVFFAACWYFSAILVVVLLRTLLGLSLVHLIWLLVFARLIHIAAQILFIGRIWHTGKRQLEPVK